MSAMKLKKREKGSIHDLKKIKSLLGRWFHEIKSEKCDSKGNDSTFIQRGTIVSVKNFPKLTFMVFCVWNRRGKGSKLFPSDKQYPSWPVNKKELKSFRLGVREVTVGFTENGLKKVQYKKYADIEDGVNVRKTYMMIKLEDIEKVHFKVEE